MLRALPVLLLLLCGLGDNANAATPRVITLSPAQTELAFAAGITPVAVSAWSDFPAQATTLPQVADWQGINSEKIISLHPDVVLAWRGGNPARSLEQLETLGIKVLRFDPDSVAGIAAALRALAAYSPSPEKAQRAAETLEQRWDALQQQYRTTPRRKVFVQFGTNPLFTSGRHSLQNEIIHGCGGDNIFANSSVPWPQVSREQVLARHPQLIIFPGNAQKAEAIRRFWQQQLTVPLIAVNDDWFVRASPRIILAAEQICAALAAKP